MSGHCCHDDCDCRRRDFLLDVTAAKEVARERGVARPVEFTFRRRRPLRWWQFWRDRESLDARAEGEARHWAARPLDAVNHHDITILFDNVQTVLRVLLHEIEHCVQAESFPTVKAWGRAYRGHERDWEDAAILAEAEWENYGYIIQPKE